MKILVEPMMKSAMPPPSAATPPARTPMPALRAETLGDVDDGAGVEVGRRALEREGDEDRARGHGGHAEDDREDAADAHPLAPGLDAHVHVAGHAGEVEGRARGVLVVGQDEHVALRPIEDRVAGRGAHLALRGEDDAVAAVGADRGPSVAR